MTGSVRDVIVVGAGPAGCGTASFLASEGFSVLVLEEHHRVGEPVHCTGIVGEELFREFSLPPHLSARELRPFVVHSPKGASFELPQGLKVFSVDRSALDSYLAERAMAAGAELALDTRVEAVEQAGDLVTVVASSRGGPRELRCRLCVLATGAMSGLPARAGAGAPPGHLESVQQEVMMPTLRGVELYLGGAVAPGSFAYAVEDVGKGARIGLMAASGAVECWRNFRALPAFRGRIDGESGKPRMRRLPLGPASRSVNGRIMLVGDAAGQVKSTTGGGVYFGLVGARILAETVKAARRPGGDFHLAGLACYERSWRRRLGGEIAIGMFVRKAFSRVSDESLEELVRILDSPGAREIVAREGRWDAHRGLVLSLMRIGSFRALLLHILREGVVGARA